MPNSHFQISIKKYIVYEWTLSSQQVYNTNKTTNMKVIGLFFFYAEGIRCVVEFINYFLTCNETKIEYFFITILRQILKFNIQKKSILNWLYNIILAMIIKNRLGDMFQTKRKKKNEENGGKKAENFSYKFKISRSNYSSNFEFKLKLFSFGYIV